MMLLAAMFNFALLCTELFFIDWIWFKQTKVGAEIYPYALAAMVLITVNMFVTFCVFL